MEEKIYKTMEAGGATSLAVGICVLVGRHCRWRAFYCSRSKVTKSEK